MENLIDNPEGTYTVKISLTLYKQFIEDSAFSQALSEYGVDNWEGYDDAMDRYRELKREYKENPPIIFKNGEQVRES